jgi:hypothetical protein
MTVAFLMMSARMLLQPIESAARDTDSLPATRRPFNGWMRLANGAGMTRPNPDPTGESRPPAEP